MVRVLGEFPLTWIEEPLACNRPAWEWGQVAGESTAPLAAGENLRGALEFHQTLAESHLGFVQPDCCKWGGASATLPVAHAIVATGACLLPALPWGAGSVSSPRCTCSPPCAAVRGRGMLEMDANPNPLRTLLIDPVLRMTDGMVAVPATPGLGIEPDVEELGHYVVLKTQRDA